MLSSDSSLIPARNTDIAEDRIACRPYYEYTQHLQQPVMFQQLVVATGNKRFSFGINTQIGQGSKFGSSLSNHNAKIMQLLSQLSQNTVLCVSQDHSPVIVLGYVTLAYMYAYHHAVSAV